MMLRIKGNKRVTVVDSSTCKDHKIIVVSHNDDILFTIRYKGKEDDLKYYLLEQGIEPVDIQEIIKLLK